MLTLPYIYSQFPFPAGFSQPFVPDFPFPPVFTSVFSIHFYWPENSYCIGGKTPGNFSGLQGHKKPVGVGKNVLVLRQGFSITSAAKIICTAGLEWFFYSACRCS